jgi:hypothetical protein
MNDVENNACNFFALFPCECKKHYEYQTFKSAGDFISFLEEMCSHFRTEPVIDSLPFICGVTVGEKRNECYVYSFQPDNGKENPSRIKWTGDGTVHAILENERKDMKKKMHFIINKSINIVRSQTADKVYGRCMEIVSPER